MGSLIDKFTYAGTQSIKDSRLKRRIILSNHLAMILAGLILLFLVLLVAKNGWPRYSNRNILLASLLTAFSIPLLNQKGHNKLANLLLSFLPPLTCLFISIFDKKLNYIFANIPGNDFYTFRFLILATSLIPLTLYALKQRGWLFAALQPSFLGLLFFDALHNLFGVGFYQLGSPWISFLFSRPSLNVTPSKQRSKVDLWYSPITFVREVYSLLDQNFITARLESLVGIFPRQNFNTYPKILPLLTDKVFV